MLSEGLSHMQSSRIGLASLGSEVSAGLELSVSRAECRARMYFLRLGLKLSPRTFLSPQPVESWNLRVTRLKGFSRSRTSFSWEQPMRRHPAIRSFGIRI